MLLFAGYLVSSHGICSSPMTSKVWHALSTAGIEAASRTESSVLSGTLLIHKIMPLGGQQAYHMSVLYPSFVQHMVCLAGSARTSWHNWCFLEGPRSALVASVDYEDGNYRTPVRKGTSAFGRVYSTWALSQEWFRQESWKVAGFETLQEYLDTNWSGEAGLGGWDANDLLCLLKTWQMGNVCNLNEEDGNDLKKTLGRIEARCLVMPSRTDTYFPPEDNQEEIKHLKDGKLVVIESIWGHLAGGGGGGGTKVN